MQHPYGGYEPHGHINHSSDMIFRLLLLRTPGRVLAWLGTCAIMSDQRDTVPPELTPEEVEVLKEIVRGHLATRWIVARSKTVATWFAAIVGAWLLFESQLTKFINRLIGQ